MKQVLLFTLAEGNTTSHRVVLEAIASHEVHAGVPTPLHLAATSADEIKSWCERMRDNALLVPVFDRQPRKGCPNDQVKRAFRFVTRGDDATHAFPAWVPAGITQAVKVYPRCQWEGLARACALQTMTEFERWRPRPSQPTRRARPDRAHFPGDRAPYLAD